MKDPLNARLPRQFKNELGKYLVIFILMAFSIALEAGYQVGDGSMIKAYNESFEKYRIEDGKFETKDKMNLAQKNAIEGYGIKVYENFYVTLKDESEKTYRLFKIRRQIDLIDIFEGQLPERDDEIALDRAFCDNNDLSLGDIITIEGDDFVLCGKIALSDYSALFADNRDIMFDAVYFSVGVISDAKFDTYKNVTYNYVYLYEKAPVDEADEKDKADELSRKINSRLALNSFTPRYLNKAICFTGEDMGSDRGMMDTLFCIIIVIMAFVFAVTASNTIQKEMSIIGTLLASGYTKKELIIHYMKLPLIVTLAAAITGNILGYTWMKNVVVNLYYNSYSLPTYHTIFSGEAFIKTTLIPLIMMVVINVAVLVYKLQMPILNFLRRQNTTSLNHKAFPLNKKIPFLARYRTRIFLKNIPSFLVMLVGIVFANLLILFGLDFPVLLDSFEKEMVEHPLAEYITMLNMPASMNREDHKLETAFEMIDFYDAVSTENETAEKISAYSLKTLPNGSYNGESVTVYGIEEDSGFIDLDLDEHQIYISSAYADKFELRQGDSITLKEEYDDKQYRFTIDGTYDYLGSLCIFMSREDLNKVFDMDKDTFVGYFSKTAIDDIDEKYKGSVIDQTALTKLSRQLKVSFSGMMDLVVAFAVVIYIVIIYILCKMMIESSSQSISMSKIMGYTDKEIASLYIVTGFIVFVLLLAGSMPLEMKALVLVFRYMLTTKMSGWFPLTISWEVIFKTIFIAIASYGIVTLLELRKIAKIPMDQALKNVE